MSNSEEKKYFQRLGVVPTSVENIKKIIKNNIKNTLKCWNKGLDIEKQTFRISGDAGVGKTEVSIQLAKELTEETGIKFEHIIIKAPVLSRDDLLCPFPIDSTKFKMLISDFIPNDENSNGIFIIDELSRGDHSFQQLCWQIQNECKVHTKDLPKNWFVICLDNPDDSEYSMNNIEDAAGIRRVLHLYAEVNVQVFLSYAIKTKFHPLVIEFIQIHPDYLYDFDSQKIGSIYANPASWKRVSNILWGYDEDNGILKNLDEINILVDGLLNQYMARLFMGYIKDRKDISPSDILFKYSEVRNDILELVKNSNNAKMSQIMDSFVTFLLTLKPKLENIYLQNISEFLSDLPSDISIMYLTNIASLKKSKGKDSEEFKYATNIHEKLISNEKYRIKFYEEMVKVSGRVHDKK